MKRIVFVFAAFAAGSLAFLAPVHAATSGTSNVVLKAQAKAKIQITDPTLDLTPTSTDYDNDYVEATGASGLRVRVQANSQTGLALLVRCSDPSPQIALADLLLRSLTAPGGAGTSIATYTAVTASDQTLWTSTVPQNGWLTVTTDVRVENLGGYNAAAGPGTTDYTNTLTYSVIVQ